MGFISDTNKYYIGVRSSETTFSKYYFKGQVCLFSSEQDNDFFTVRPNQNIRNKEIPLYFAKRIHEIMINPDARFVFYNQANAYNYSLEVLNNCLFLNPHEILEFLNNKTTLKKWLLNCGIPIISFETFLGEDITYPTLFSHFPNAESFVVQNTHGGGGIGTFLFDKDNHIGIYDNLLKTQQYLVSPYLKKTVSVNTHVFVSNKSSIISPGSIQIIELHNNQLCYRGADFIEFRRLPINLRTKVKQLSIEICDLLQAKGYRGVAGIDFIIDQSQQQVYCSEINPRFQASSILIDQYLLQKNGNIKSIFELNEMAFNNELDQALCFEDSINSSCYYYYGDENTPDYIERRYQILREAGSMVFLDGLNSYLPKGVNSDSYLFSSIFAHSICKVSPDMTLWINDNIVLTPKPKDILGLKIALLNQGIRISNMDHFKQGVYESVDIDIQPCQITQGKRLVVNCPRGIHLSKYSPYEVTVSKLSSELYYYSEKIADIDVEIDQLRDLSEEQRRILYLATDRLRIKLISGCDYRNVGKSCRFCNLPISLYKFSLEEIEGALNALQTKGIEFRHILIGGGTSLSPYVWDDICSLCKLLKSKLYFKDKAISLMSILPPLNVLEKLKEAGIDEVAFNLEIANDKLACQYMPGKRQTSKEEYYHIFKTAIQIFGSGNVRTSLIAGLDTEDDLLAEVLELAQIGVLPCISLFRALPGSIFENDLGPENKYCRVIHDRIAEQLAQLSEQIREVGPKCISCRNNMLCI